jgi:hypothetical protein
MQDKLCFTEIYVLPNQIGSELGNKCIAAECPHPHAGRGEGEGVEGVGGLPKRSFITARLC